jgi:hypothetical protein
MSRQEKLTKRLLTIPKDFTWDELIKVLSFYGFDELNGGKTGGSRRRFVDGKKTVLRFHKPHPGNIVKEYVIRQLIDELKSKGYLKDE